ncbi:NAD(P)-dependent oxidoreductase [Neptuniibacter caesariensis]|uniref:Putative oxidoreductase protein n=1 Tax=Neptuniibacter caesariensis TaxID=207954 RepID=A0A7U8C1A7_NEPCE|nr:NAD(P)-dependent oxidoreductase [Neptuniibacter caesariensis]EAR59685.1 putative oxidoreductase protein [Oceanospirillum sp. MED92] [Neptuniibacter caesariensis]
MKVAFIGLGVMGYPMAGHLSKAGHDVTVFNRTTAKAEAWSEDYKGAFAVTPAEAAKGADIVFTCVGNDDDLREVTCGDQGVFNGMTEGSILVDHTTASAEIARELASLAADKGIGFLDAPVSGGQAGAENGVLSVMVGGDQASFDKAEPVMDAYSKSIRLLGEAGAGQLAKMVNQICIAGLVQGLAEGVHFAKRAGLDAAQVFDVIQHGAAGSWQMVNRHQTMIDDEYDFGFAVDWMRKDLNIVLDEARKNGARLPITAIVDQFYADVQEMGGNRCDTSSLLMRLEKREK